jgi:hypothetical protein
MEPDRKNTESQEDSLTELRGYGDRELWYAEGRDGSWKFPLWVEWRENVKTGQHYAFIVPCLCPYYKQGLILKALFELHDVIDKPNKWLIRKEMVEALLKKAPGVTPKCYYFWEGAEAKPLEFTRMTMPEAKQPKRFRSALGDSKLVKTIAKECGLQSSVVTIVLDGLRMAAVELLIEEQAPIDLGFCKLVAVPFRANWKEIVCCKMRRYGLLKTLKAGKEAATAAGMPEKLCSPHNIGFRGSRGGACSRMDYSIEVIPSKEFESAVTERESRIRLVGRTSYVRKYEQTVEALYDDILEILKAYLQKVNLPFARVSESKQSGGLRFVPTRGVHARAHGVNLRYIPVHIIPPVRGFSALAEANVKGRLHLPAAEVQKVPVVLPAPKDVRQCEERGGVAELGDGGNGDGWVHVPHACASLALWEPVFPCVEAGTGQPSGVDAEGDRR